MTGPESPDRTRAIAFAGRGSPAHQRGRIRKNENSVSARQNATLTLPSALRYNHFRLISLPSDRPGIASGAETPPDGVASSNDIEPNITFP